MKLARLGDPGDETPVLIDGECICDLASVVSDIDGPMLAAGGIDAVRPAFDSGTLPALADANTMRIGSPIARPGAIICIGMNYAAHAAESGSQPPDVPIVFLKTPNTLAGPNDPAAIPRGSSKTDWEVETGVVIGKRALYLDESDHRNLRLRSWVNGEPRQDSSTADMIFNVEYIIRDLSQYMALDPGDVVEIEIEGLGRQRQEFRQW